MRTLAGSRWALLGRHAAPLALALALASRGFADPPMPQVVFGPPVGVDAPSTLALRQPPSPKPAANPAPAGDTPEQGALGLRLTPPTPALLFRLESEAALRARIRKEVQASPKLPAAEFPPDRVPGPFVVPRRVWPWYVKQVEPNYLCYGRLYFQQVALERYGANLGVAEPLVSAGWFFGDVLAFPLRAMFWPCQPYQCSADGYSPFFDGWPRQR